MFAFFHRRTKRRTVMVTLIAWVFALMAGIANACLLQDRGAGHDGSVQEHGSTGHAIGIHPDPSAVSVDGAPGLADEPSTDTDGYKDSCKKHCDSEASTAVKQKSDDLPDFGHAAAQVGTWARNLGTVAVAVQPADDRLPTHGPPIAIRLLRLTL